MVRDVTLYVLFAVLLVAPSTALAQTDVRGSTHHGYQVVTVVDGLEVPWSMAFLPNGDMLVTERPGRLRIVRNGQLLADPVPGVPAVFAEGQGGLFDVLLHPDFATNRLLYLSFARETPGGSATAVVRGRFENDRLTAIEEVFEATAQGRGHYGGRMAFDPAGYLFLTAGDRMVPSTGDLEAHPAQDLSNHHGVTIRLNDDGSVPADNPFVDQPGVLPEIWSYGHRNPQGLAIDPATGNVWINEHGPQGGDELNLIQPGLNYGWPVVGYGVNYRSGLAIHEGTHREEVEAPVHFWVPSIATSGMMIYSGDRFPEWRGNIFVGGLAGQQIARLTMQVDRPSQTAWEETLGHGLGRIRDIRQSPDGYIYVAIEGRGGATTPIVRLEPAPSTN